MNEIEIFRAGTHTAMNGNRYTIGTADLAACASAYDTAIGEAPLVVGHPETNDPAYGWVSGLKVDGDRLVAVPNQVDAAFAEMVAAGRFKKRSASFYPPDHPANPKPGTYYLKHVGFLGAVPPAVPGLKEVSFAAVDGTIDFADWSGLTIAGLFGSLRDLLISQFGQDKAEAALPSGAIDSLKFDAAQPDPDPTDAGPAFATPPTTETIPLTTKTPAGTATPEELEARATKLAASEAAFAERTRKARETETATFVDGLITAGKFPKGERAGFIAFMAAIPAGDDVVIEFAQADGQKATVDPTAYLKGLFGRLPNLVEFGEIASGGTVDFAQSTDAITARSQKYIKEQADLGRTVSPAEAVAHVRGMR